MARGHTKMKGVMVALLQNTTKHGLENKMARINCI